MSIAQEIGFVSLRYGYYTKDGETVIPVKINSTCLDDDVIWFSDADKGALWETGLTGRVNIKSADYLLFNRYTKLDTHTKLCQAYRDMVKILTKFDTNFPGLPWRIAPRQCAGFRGRI
ncbi:hypothetical protein CRG49_009985 [Neisseria sp. N95_16]|uniref:Uncharacterized protein n=1 Tax=Neisseria brasiliensis TaxID=2666100 RepID=A0A5Q3RW91_9NEIS|nr:MULTISPECIES: hypothetical protein [Neisseria]MRN38871.1 hypothetical protein [Neisseria brasiliensis]PJO08983.1 hypothetical protein CRG49_009985 [Neisseria sp. N95_16]PJO78277.1 hypothetical protein CWC45_06040 [Neisseria sp. N177_16]QGL24265.1 hypothetical protein GJV52_01100 [Neisseria brasiliensis]